MQFWKQFFEAAANVSLSGYEELANEPTNDGANETTEYTGVDESRDETVVGGGGGTPAGGEASAMDYTRDDSVLSDGGGDLSGSTPRAPTRTMSMRLPSSHQKQPSTHSSTNPQIADMDSPYENLRREMAASKAKPQVKAEAEDGDESTLMHFDDNDNDTAEEELLAQRTARLPDMSMTPRQSLDERNKRLLEDEQAALRRQKDPLMHRVLGKDYRIQATPHRSPQRPRLHVGAGAKDIRQKELEREEQREKEKQKEKEKQRSAWSSPMSSPEMAVPKLRSAAFLSPLKQAYRSKLAAATASSNGPRTPGVSVQTPRPKRTAASAFDDDESGAPDASGRDYREFKGNNEYNEYKDYDDNDDNGDGWSSGDDLYGGMSPPKTISFALPPSKLLQTPAREASKRIVKDILMTAGEDPDEDSLDLDDGGLSEYSPTMVKTNANILDDTF